MKTTPPADNASCRRCGQCCQRGGPALHRQDLPLFSGPQALDLSHIVTLRAGESALDQPSGRIAALEAEVLKLGGGAEGPACPLMAPGGRECAIYRRRPAECRALFCRDTSALAAMYDRDRLSRADLLPAGHGLLAVLAEHEALVPPRRIPVLAERLRAGGQEALDAGEELTRMALADRAFRTGLAERAHIGPEYHEFFLGRAAGLLFAAAGIDLRADARTGLRVQPDPLWAGGATIHLTETGT